MSTYCESCEAFARLVERQKKRIKELSEENKKLREAQKSQQRGG